MKTKIFLFALAAAFSALSINAYAEHGDEHGNGKRDSKQPKGYNYKEYKESFGKGCMEEGCVEVGCFGLGLFLNPVFVHHPHRVWVNGHWGYDPYGWKVWIPGHWSHTN